MTTLMEAVMMQAGTLEKKAPDNSNDNGTPMASALAPGTTLIADGTASGAASEEEEEGALGEGRAIGGGKRKACM